MPAAARDPSLPAVLSTRAGRALGMTPRQLGHRCLTTPTRGIHVVRTPTSADEICAALADVLPAGTAFSHHTAARLLRLPLPAPWDPGEPVHVTHPTAQIRRPGVVGHRARRPTGVERGLRVTSPVATWRDLAPALDLDDLVALADAVRYRWPAAASALEAASASGTGRGRTRAAAASALARAGVESPWETHTRLAVVRAGLPEPAVNARVLDEQGRFVARVDLLWPEQRVVVEYEGDQHRSDKRQWRHDITRLRRLEALGYRVLRVTRDDLLPGAARERFLADLRRALGL